MLTTLKYYFYIRKKLIWPVASTNNVVKSKCSWIHSLKWDEKIRGLVGWLLSIASWRAEHGLGVLGIMIILFRYGSKK
jgi:hypothetical protein